jgi:hypothetical protein
MAPEDAKATIEQVLQSTGRDGAVDLVAKMHAFGLLPATAAERQLARLIGFTMGGSLILIMVLYSLVL